MPKQDHSLSLATALQSATHTLALVSDSARLDAEILLGHLLGETRSFLYTWPDKTLSHTQAQQFGSLIDRRHNGEPVAYIIERQAFWSLDLQVSPDTLIPRPETEVLVELALQYIPDNKTCNVADLGTGSGAIALAIAHERPLSNIIASDQSKAALSIAHKNAERLKISNITFHQSDWLTDIDNPRLDVIISNPPYVDGDDIHLQQGDLRFEPLSALSPGQDGLLSIREIIKQAALSLNDGGWLLLEHGYTQGMAVRQCFKSHHFQNIRTVNDLADNERVTLAQYHQAPYNTAR